LQKFCTYKYYQSLFNPLNFFSNFTTGIWLLRTSF